MQRLVLLVFAIALVIFLLFLLLTNIFFVKKPKSGFALVRTGSGGLRVIFDKLTVIFPFLHNFDYVDITPKIIPIETKRTKLKDGKFVNIRATFHVKLILTQYDVEKAFNTFGAEKMNNPKFISQIFEPKLKEAVESVAIHFTSEEFTRETEKFKSEVFNYLGKDFNGYNVEECIFELPK